MHGYFHRKEMPRYIPKNVPIIRRKPLWASQVDGDMLIGKVKKVSRIGLDKIDCLHVSVPENRFYHCFFFKLLNFHSFFDYGLLFYRTAKFHWALDPESKGALGDVVLIRKATEEQQFTSTVPYYVDRVVFKYGSMIDPISKVCCICPWETINSCEFSV